jgi:hypothetical protein
MSYFALAKEIEAEDFAQDMSIRRGESMTDDDFERWDQNCRDREDRYDEQVEYDDIAMEQQQDDDWCQELRPFTSAQLVQMLEKHCSEHPDKVNLPLMSNCYKLDSNGNCYPACATVSAIDFDFKEGPDYKPLFDERLDEGPPMTVADMLTRCRVLAAEFPEYCPTARHRDNGGNSQLEMLWTKKVTTTEKGEQREWTLIGSVDYYRACSGTFSGW